MTLELFLNDLSIPDEDCALDVATVRLRSLAATLRAVTSVSPRYVLNADRPFADLMLGRNRPLASLRNEPSVADERVYIKTIVDRSPWTTALAMRPPDAAGGAEYRMLPDAPVRADADAVALGLAHDLSGLAISLATHDHWAQCRVEIERRALDDDAVLIARRLHAPNASCAAHIDEHAVAIAAHAAPAVHDGAELWARRTELLPNLRFIPSVEGQLTPLGHGDPNLQGAVERLVEIDEAIAGWRKNGTAKPDYASSVVPESRQRRQKGLADFHDATGTKRTFSLHARYGPDENRIHLILETDPERHALIGHVGRKLGIG
jgi:hypothetical protein